MGEHTYLHDAEVLLCRARPTVALLVASCLRGLLNALLVAGVVFLIVGSIIWNVYGSFPGMAWFIVIYVTCALLFCIAAYRQWTRVQLRITSERILLDRPKHLTSISTRTIKWPQFQESFTKSGGPLAAFWRSKTLCIRFGSSDGEMILTFPCLRLAKDIKHYLDKADTLIRKNQVSELRPFVEKPRGQRDLPDSGDHAG